MHERHKRHATSATRPCCNHRHPSSTTDHTAAMSKLALEVHVLVNNAGLDMAGPFVSKDEVTEGKAIGRAFRTTRLLQLAQLSYVCRAA